MGRGDRGSGRLFREVPRQRPHDPDVYLDLQKAQPGPTAKPDVPHGHDSVTVTTGPSVVRNDSATTQRQSRGCGGHGDGRARRDAHFPMKLKCLVFQERVSEKWRVAHASSVKRHTCLRACVGEEAARGSGRSGNVTLRCDITSHVSSSEPRMGSFACEIRCRPGAYPRPGPRQRQTAKVATAVVGGDGQTWAPFLSAGP